MNKEAANKKYYKVKPCVLSQAEDDLPWVRNHNLEPIRLIPHEIVECSKPDGDFIIMESEDRLECPFPECIDPRRCFETSIILCADVYVNEKTGKSYRLIGKECITYQRSYIFQHKMRHGEYEAFYSGRSFGLLDTSASFGYPNLYPYQDATVFHIFRLNRVVKKDVFDNRCLFCKAGNNNKDKRLVISAGPYEDVQTVICETCKSKFYIADCQVIYEKSFNDICPLCGEKYALAEGFKIEMPPQVYGIYSVACRSCKGHYLILSNGEFQSKFVKEAFRQFFGSIK